MKTTNPEYLTTMKTLKSLRVKKKLCQINSTRSSNILKAYFKYELMDFLH